ncbi:MAG: DNA repair protein RecO [Halothece sp. Uz-M2-17]|nr:DNA repair protein RecO [Halothece sp. Uz-M2-17]
MSKTYQVTGINLKGVPFGERDRLLTILTPEQGLIRAVAGGARKYQSRLRGRSELFVVNQLLLVKGRSSLYRLTQAETVQTYPKLSQHLGKLAVSQYLAEIILSFALSDQPQPELFTLLQEHLNRIETFAVSTEAFPSSLFPLLNQGIFHLLSLAGVAPQLHQCCLSQRPLKLDETNPHWRVGFSYQAGGIVLHSEESVNHLLNVGELKLLQQLSQSTLPASFSAEVDHLKTIERLLRNYTEYHFHRSIRSANLVDTLLSPTTNEQQITRNK